MILTFYESIPREGNARSFVFTPDKPVSWQAGQYTHFALKFDDVDERGDNRWFTISSAPSEQNIMITTRIDTEHGSSFKRALLALKPGDKVEADTPEGDFVVDDPSRNLIFIAGGIGITPFRSILTEAVAQGEPLNVDMLYANRSPEVAFQAELNELQEANPHLNIRYVIDPEKLDEALLKQKISEAENPLVYISGPEPMVEALTDQVAGLGVAKENIRSDYFPGYEPE